MPGLIARFLEAPVRAEMQRRAEAIIQAAKGLQLTEQRVALAMENSNKSREKLTQAITAYTEMLQKLIAETI